MIYRINGGQNLASLLFIGYLISICKILHELGTLIKHRIRDIGAVQFSDKFADGRIVMLMHPFLHAGADLGNQFGTVGI